MIIVGFIAIVLGYPNIRKPYSIVDGLVSRIAGFDKTVNKTAEPSIVITTCVV